MPWGHRAGRHHRRRPDSRGVLAVAGFLSVCAGSAIAVHIGAFLVHSSVAGGALVGAERTAIARAASRPAACAAPGGGPGRAARGTAGLLEVPALGLTAPVLQGTGEAVLSEAVGHDPASAWPGQPGTSVLSAHDVTWFSRIARLRHGMRITYVTPCRTYAFTVTSHAIVTAGSPVYSTGAARLVLDTCYPLNALYITPDRYLVYAALAGSAPTHVMAAVPGSWPVPVVPAPARLAAQGLGLAGNHAPLGTLRLAGSPARAWSQGNTPFRFEAAALAGYFAITRTAAQQERAWWAALAPSVPVPAAGPLWGGQISSYGSALAITLHARGTRAVSATLSATVAVTSEDGTASYSLTVRESARGGRLLITGVRVTPAG